MKMLCAADTQRLFSHFGSCRMFLDPVNCKPTHFHSFCCAFEFAYSAAARGRLRDVLWPALWQCGVAEVGRAGTSAGGFQRAIPSAEAAVKHSKQKRHYQQLGSPNATDSFAHSTHFGADQRKCSTVNTASVADLLVSLRATDSSSPPSRTNIA